jgi:molecular chaperone GrpE
MATKKTNKEEEKSVNSSEDVVTETDEMTQLKEQLAQKTAEVEELNDQLLRKIAEFDNYRKRTLKEKAELILNGGEKTISAILPVLDDMERALSGMKNSEDISAVIEGVELIYKKFVDTLEKQGVTIIETKDADFDVDLHEAIAQIPAPTEEMKGKIIDCTLKGYKMGDKVIRHSQVVVGM